MKCTFPLLLILFTISVAAQQKKLAYQNNNAQYHFNNAKVFRSDNRIDLAILSLNKALQYNQIDPNIYYLLAKCYFDMGNTEEARNYENLALIAFEKGHFLKISPYYLYHDYGVMNLTSLNYQLAYYCFNEALRYKATAVGVYNRGTSLLYLKDYKKACADWRVARNNGIENADKLINTWCKYCAADSAIYTLRNDSTTFLDFYPPNTDTLTIALYFTNKWYLTHKHSNYYRIAKWIISKQQFEGHFEDYHLTNKVAEGNYSDGLLNGLYTSFYNDGKPKSQGFFTDGEPSGSWNYYYQDGKPWLSIEFNNNNFEITSCRDKNGKTTLHNGNGTWDYTVIIDHKIKYNIEGRYTNYHRSGNWEISCTPNYYNITEIYDNEGRLKKTTNSLKAGNQKNLEPLLIRNFFVEFKHERIDNFLSESDKAYAAYSFLSQ